MIALIIILIVLIICFGGVLMFGAPYLPTLKPQVMAALELADLKPGESLLELGCGDGKVVVAAARQGIKVIGYELNPLLAAVAWLRTRRYHGQVKIICADFWRAKLPPSEAIFVFLLPKFMDRLNDKIDDEAAKPVKLVSFAFLINNRTPDGHKAGVYLYNYD